MGIWWRLEHSLRRGRKELREEGEIEKEFPSRRGKKKGENQSNQIKSNQC